MGASADPLAAVPGIDLDTTSTRPALRATGAAPGLTGSTTGTAPAAPPKTVVSATPSTATPRSASTQPITPITLPGVTPTTPTVGAAGQMPQSAGPVTGDMVVASGLPGAEPEKDAWAALANWMTKGESQRNMGAFTELFNGQPWTGPNTDHPAFLGWPGDTYNGSPTSAYGLFQDEKGTWHDIAHNYLGGDTRMTPENQIKGNLMMAADLYQKRTGRNIVADFKAGNVSLIEQTLKDQWPTLGGGGGIDHGDDAYHHYISSQSSAIDHLTKEVESLMTAANRADPMSDAQHALLSRAMSRSEELAKRFDQLSLDPPKKQSPMEAANSMAPILGLLVALGGFATRRPALGAMNAMTGMLTGMKEGNDQKYDVAFNLWKTQTTFAHDAYQMQNESVRNIMDDMRLSAEEKQNKVMNALRFFGLKQDLELAKAGMWKDVWERQQQRETNQSLISLRKAQAEKAFADAALANRKAKFAGGMTGNAASFYETLAQQYLADPVHADLGGDPDKIPIDDQLRLKERARLEASSVSRPLTPPQVQINDRIKAVQEHIGTLPSDFEEKVADSKHQYSDKEMAAMNLTPVQRALFDALRKPNMLQSSEEAALVKQYNDWYKRPLLQPSRVITGAEGAASEGQVGPTGSAPDLNALIAGVQRLLDEGYSREQVRAMWINNGGDAADFDANFPEGVTVNPVIDPTGVGLDPAAFNPGG